MGKWHPTNFPACWLVSFNLHCFSQSTSRYASHWNYVVSWMSKAYGPPKIRHKMGWLFLSSPINFTHLLIFWDAPVKGFKQHISTAHSWFQRQLKPKELRKSVDFRHVTKATANPWQLLFCPRDGWIMKAETGSGTILAPRDTFQTVNVSQATNGCLAWLSTGAYNLLPIYGKSHPPHLRVQILQNFQGVFRPNHPFRESSIDAKDQSHLLLVQHLSHCF